MVGRVKTFPYSADRSKYMWEEGGHADTTRTDDEANLHVTARASLRDGFVREPDGLLNVEPVKVHLSRTAILFRPAAFSIPTTYLNARSLSALTVLFSARSPTPISALHSKPLKCTLAHL